MEVKVKVAETNHQVIGVYAKRDTLVLAVTFPSMFVPVNLALMADFVK